MAKTRMNQRARDILSQRAREKAKKLIDRAKYTKLRETLVKRTNELVKKRYPEADMKVLKKYELASPDRCFLVVRTDIDNQSPETFNFKEGEITELSPSNPGCRSRGAYPVTQAYLELMRSVVRQAEADQKAENLIYYDFRKLIDNVRYFEDLLEVWPEAGSWREELFPGSGTGLSVLSQDVRDRLSGYIKSETPIVATA